ncbi:hypothetical protein ABZS86_29095 [Streptomyces sp. NPDC005355]|uniref:hypothetical protein n=1 Tax=Streptomyces sp. NPDC005355 TaxID=3157038 RepID=UPI0033B11A01
MGADRSDAELPRAVAKGDADALAALAGAAAGGMVDGGRAFALGAAGYPMRGARSEGPAPRR